MRFDHKMRAEIKVTRAHSDPVPTIKWEALAPLLGLDVGAFAAPEFADPEAEFVVEDPLALDDIDIDTDDAEAEAETEAEELPLILEVLEPDSKEVLASLPVKAPSATLLDTTGAEFESELTYHLWPKASGIALISHPFDRPTGNAAMNASTSVSLISCSRELIPGDLGPSNHFVISARTDSWV